MFSLCKQGQQLSQKKNPLLMEKLGQLVRQRFKGEVESEGGVRCGGGGGGSVGGSGVGGGGHGARRARRNIAKLQEQVGPAASSSLPGRTTWPTIRLHLC